MTAMVRRRVAGVVALLVLLYLTTTVVTATAVRAAGPEPTYGTAVVDGAIDEWDLNRDFFADMILAGGQGGQTDVLGKAYLRYDCETSSLYVLALSDGAFDGLQNAWVKIYDIQQGEINGAEAVVTDAQGTPIGFETVVADLPAGDYGSLEIHFNTDGDTASNVKGGGPLTIVCSDSTTTTTTEQTTTTDETTTSTGETTTTSDATTTTTSDATTTTEGSTTTSEGDVVVGGTVVTTAAPEGAVPTIAGTVVTTAAVIAVDTLPFTGAEAQNMVILAIGVLLTGALLLVSVKRTEAAPGRHARPWSDR